MSDDYSNDLIFGKNKLERIVSVEPKGDTLFVFQEQQDGAVTRLELPASYWFITNQKVSGKQVKLEGNQYYKFLGEFSEEEEFDKIRTLLYQKRIDYYSIWDKKEQNLVRQGITYFKGMKPQEVSILSFDIETDGIKLSNQSEIYIITNTYRNKKALIKKTFLLENYSNQKDMLEDWCKWVREIDPSIICGHNIYVYDFSYIRHVANLCGAKLVLGRNGEEITFNHKPSMKRKDGSQEYEYHKIHIHGREICDTFFLALTYDVGRKFESYGLKSIIRELGHEKCDRTFVDASKIKLYYNNRKSDSEMWKKVVAYAEDDSDDSLKLFDLMIPAFFYITQSISKTFTEMVNSATGSQINNFLVRSYLQHDGAIPKASEITEKVEGGISFAIPGIYRNLGKADLRSAYPSQILRFKLFDKLKDPNANYYKMVEYFANARFELKRLYKETKDSYYKDRDGAAKVFLNSAYGVTITKGLNFNSPAIGAKITESTREVINLALIWASGKDKVYWMNKFNSAVGKEVQDE